MGLNLTSLFLPYFITTFSLLFLMCLLSLCSSFLYCFIISCMMVISMLMFSNHSNKAATFVLQQSSHICVATKQPHLCCNKATPFVGNKAVTFVATICVEQCIL